MRIQESKILGAPGFMASQSIRVFRSPGEDPEHTTFAGHGETRAKAIAKCLEVMAYGLDRAIVGGVRAV